MMEIKNLNVSVEGKEILKDLNIKFEEGKVYALIGRNGSGKSTLANAIMGNPKYTVDSGEIILDGENIVPLKPNERAKKEIFLSYQNPVAVEGVSISNFLRTAFNSVKKDKLSMLEFQKILSEKAKEVGIEDSFLGRYLNDGFSGGEKKKAEILQLLVLNPRIAILDETDSGLDVDSLKTISKGINNFMKSNSNKTVIIITHYRRILDYIKPDKIFVMSEGKIISEGGMELMEKIEKGGYREVETENAN